MAVCVLYLSFMLLVESKEKLKELKERFEDIQLSLGTTFRLKG